MNILIAEFAEPEDMLSAAQQAKSAGDRLLDAFTPSQVDGMKELLGVNSTRMRAVMFAGGIAVALLAFGTEYYSAVFDYPINSGGRPLNSWPAFMMFPFAVGILGAAVSGFIALMADTGLPRLHHPLFAIEGFERANRDRFFLAIAPHEGKRTATSAQTRLRKAGALSVREIET